MYNAISVSAFRILRPSGPKHAPMKSTTVPMNHSESAYLSLPKYCQDLEANNPNSTVILEKAEDYKFLRVFICYGASAMGFDHCRPLLGIDGTHLKHKYQGTSPFPYH